ncbi:rhomboid family intramembrane serine protease [Flavobacteriaceae bacterium AU392]|nr:rhomboid family intramembrane serine protease [Flavobacteriaceae bacterium]RKM83667.1 rhomboid family intramembrane serine protease [Flavobacteriaceae bacterium AU392]
MTSLTQDIQDKLKRLTTFEKIIAINVVVYFIGWLLATTQTNVFRSESLSWLELPNTFSEFIGKPWSIITYGFTHFEFWHLFFNMLVLYFVGRSFSNLFSIKIALNVYFLGIITGGLTFILIYALFPNGFLSNVGALVGASAGVRAALIFLCAYMPNKEVGFATIRFKLMYVGIALVFLDIVGLFGDNQGGNIAHLGGALLGYFYAIQLKKGIDIGKGFERLMDSITSLFSKKSKTKLKTVHKKSKKKTYAGHTKQEFDEFNTQKRIDIILDKISKSGYDSLNEDEKAFLFKAGKK